MNQKTLNTKTLVERANEKLPKDASAIAHIRQKMLVVACFINQLFNSDGRFM